MEISSGGVGVGAGDSSHMVAGYGNVYFAGTIATKDTGARSALFEQGELDQLQRVQARSSLLLGASAPQPGQQSDGNSTSSSENLQAEAQRQLEEYGQRQRLEMERLQQEMFNLRA